MLAFCYTHFSMNINVTVLTDALAVTSANIHLSAIYVLEFVACNTYVVKFQR